ncbi:MAG TPA: thioredoxin domain-containing protein, partial [Pyrinomonadaceae bacterium]|nr:thioredoxin domain-containing protein [Pyrinomonadaceae bacterium]
MEKHEYTNHLIHESSPYLLQHAHNPVDWYPWGEEAFARARSENKPVLLSIGYSACHWCHVMAHESFEDEEIARLMNDNFVNIKVDREERPDLDQIYMSAVQMMTHHGGWPMTVFLTPDGVPFYGGTYFPPQDRYNIPGFPRVLIGVAEAYKERPQDIAETGTSLLNELRRMSQSAGSDSPVQTELLDAAYAGIIRNYDSTNGGFGGAPKFPPAMTLEFLLRTYARTGNQDALQIVTHTCRKMAEGGIYDQLGGGFCRYSVDGDWNIPHFEKMLYDNGQLLALLVDAWRATRDPLFERCVRDTAHWLMRDMQSPEGGYYSSIDADSEHEEGKFYVWTPGEVEQLLSENEWSVVRAHWGLDRGPNFEGKHWHLR